MPPTLALLGCYAFVFWALWDDARKEPHSPTLWLPVLWMMRCGSRGIDAWIGGGENGRWDPILIGLFVAGGFWVLSQRRDFRWSEVMRRNSAVFWFYGYLILSLTWADEVESPFIKVFRPVGDLLMALVVVSEPDPRRAIQTMFRRTGLALIPLSIVVIRYYPYLGRLEDKHWGSDMWIGVATHKNPLAQLCLVAALGFIWALDDARQRGESLRRQYVTWIYLAMTAYLLNGGGHSRSSTAILCLGLAVALFWIFGRMRDRSQLVLHRVKVGVVTLIVVSLVLAVFDTSLQEIVSDLQGKESNLTGRTWLWNDVVRISMKEHPLFGSGYGGFWVPSIYGKLSPEVDNRPAEAHNGYLETFANLGFIGVALLAWIIFQTLGSAARTLRDDFEYGRLRLALFFTVLLMNYSEATFPRGTHLWWFGFLVIAVSVPPRIVDWEHEILIAPLPHEEEAATRAVEVVEPAHARVMPG